MTLDIGVSNVNHSLLWIVAPELYVKSVFWLDSYTKAHIVQAEGEVEDLNKALIDKLLELDDVDAVYSNQK
jgi:transcriptional/translational regulatory protein YebC/TACO1